MLQAFSIYGLAAGFLGAGLFNAVGTAATRQGFVSWGYPGWWCRVTGGLEVVCAVLVARPGSREVGLALGAIVIAAAILTVLRHRAFPHLAPLGVFVLLLAVAAIPA